MTSPIKPIATEVVCNTTPSTFKGAKLLRVVNKGTGVENLVYQEVHSVLALNINASANSTTLITLDQTKSNAESLAYAGIGDLVIFSTNTQVVNTGVASQIASFVNTSAFVVNVAIIIANGTCNISLSAYSANTSLLPNSDIDISKNSNSLLSSSNNSNVVATAIAYTH